MEPFEAYKIYQSIKLHFDSDTYDAVKYNYKTSAKAQSFFKRKDKYYFAKLAKKYSKKHELTEFLVANFTQGTKWVGDLIDDDAEKAFTQWQKRKQSLSYEFTKDLRYLRAWCDENGGSFDYILQVHDGQHPIVVAMLTRSEISLETVVILNKLTGFLDAADRKISEPILWPDIFKRLKKTEPFVEVDLNKMKSAVVKEFKI